MQFISKEMISRYYPIPPLTVHTDTHSTHEYIGVPHMHSRWRREGCGLTFILAAENPRGIKKMCGGGEKMKQDEEGARVHICDDPSLTADERKSFEVDVVLFLQ